VKIIGYTLNRIMEIISCFSPAKCALTSRLHLNTKQGPIIYTVPSKKKNSFPRSEECFSILFYLKRNLLLRYMTQDVSTVPPSLHSLIQECLGDHMSKYSARAVSARLDNFVFNIFHLRPTHVFEQRGVVLVTVLLSNDSAFISIC
jgi:hypothetical protein